MSRNKFINNKNKLTALEKKRKMLMRVILQEDELVAGSYIEQLVKCGKSGCKCKDKPNHFVTRLSIWKNGKLKNKIVRVKDRNWVKKRSDKYKKNRKALSELIQLNNNIKEVLKSIVQSKIVTYK